MTRVHLVSELYCCKDVVQHARSMLLCTYILLVPQIDHPCRLLVRVTAPQHNNPLA